MEHLWVQQNFLKEKKSFSKNSHCGARRFDFKWRKSGPHLTEGIGMEFIPDYMERSYFNAIHTVEDVYAFQK